MYLGHVVAALDDVADELDRAIVGLGVTACMMTNVSLPFDEVAGEEEAHRL